jgi:hypothetical protein
MVMNTALVALVGAATIGCSLNTDRKNACRVPGDCLDGFECLNNRCEASQADAGGQTDGNGPGDDLPPTDADPGEYGAVQPITVQSTGIAVTDFTLLGATVAAGNLGCALVGDESGAPGGEAAVLYAKLRGGSDRRCPDGAHAIRSGADACPFYPGSALLPQCAIYRRWDASGNLVAQRRATGGVVTIHDVALGAMAHRCEVEVAISFPGGTSVQSSFSFDFNPFGPDDTFCVH